MSKSKTVTPIKLPMPLVSKLAGQKFKSETKLPKPNVTGTKFTPSKYLIDICQYARGANSRGEYLFRINYLIPMLTQLVGKECMEQDDVGNIIVQVGEGTEVWDTLHVGHIDSVHPDDGDPYQDVEVTMLGIPATNTLRLKPWVKESIPTMIKGSRWVDGKDVGFHYAGYTTPAAPQRCLGADDGCAVAIMLYLIQSKVVGTYFFARGEEHGCIGTRYAVNNTPEFFKKFKRSIEVDRKGTEEIINKMGVGICASNEFAVALGKELNMGHKPSDKGSSTDVGVIAKLIPENVNLAAGYWKQHTANEYCHIEYVNKLGAALAAVDYAKLPVVRNAGEFHKVYKGGKGHTTYNRSNTTYGSGYQPLQRNEWGDWSSADLKSDVPFDQAYGSELEARAFIRENSSLLWELLAVLNLSNKQIVEIATTGELPDIAVQDDFLDELEERIEDTSTVGNTTH